MINDDGSSHTAHTLNMVPIIVFDKEKFNMTNAAAHREINDPKQGGISGPTFSAVVKALKIIENKTNISLNLFAMPGYSQQKLVNRAIEMVENRFDPFYLMDVERYDSSGKLIVSGSQPVDLKTSVSKFNSQFYNTDFAAAYFPSVGYEEFPGRRFPATVAALEAYSLNDSTQGSVFTAPQGSTNALLTIQSSELSTLTQKDRDLLTSSRVNFISDSEPGQIDGNTAHIIGAATLSLNKERSLHLVRIRRGLIDIRSEVRRIGLKTLFAQIREGDEAIQNFLRDSIESFLTGLQNQGSIKDFKVEIVEVSGDSVDSVVLSARVSILPTGIDLIPGLKENAVHNFVVDFD